MDVIIVAEKENYLLVARGNRIARGNRVVVLERRNNQLYNCHCGKRGGIPADDLFGLDERPVDHADFPARKPDAGAQRGRAQPPAADHRAGFGRLLGELSNGVHEAGMVGDRRRRPDLAGRPLRP